jgi:hypothetical protein
VVKTITEILLSAILTASITGAGLVIAIYALIAHLHKEIFERRLTIVQEKNREFEETKAKITPEEPWEGTQHLTAIGEEMKSLKTFPKYLGSGVQIVFTGYIISAFISVFWLTNMVQNPQAENILLFLFGLSTFVFLIVGWDGMGDVHTLMKEKFEQLKKEQQEMEKTRKELEEFKRKIREAKSKK